MAHLGIDIEVGPVSGPCIGRPATASSPRSARPNAKDGRAKRKDSRSASSAPRNRSPLARPVPYGLPAHAGPGRHSGHFLL